MQTADVLIHLNAALDEPRQRGLEEAMRGIDGVIAPRFNKPHLLLVAYNSARTSAAELHAAVTAKGFAAQLVGM